MTRRIHLLLPFSLVFSATPLAPHATSGATQLPGSDSTPAATASPSPLADTKTAGRTADHPGGAAARLHATDGTAAPDEPYLMMATFGSQPPASVTAPSPPKPGEHGLVSWAKDRFVAAGLAPPSPNVVFGDDRDTCHGHHGLFQGTHSQVSICISDGAPDHIRRKLMLHELAHAWAREHLTDHDRDTLVELRGAGSWNNHDDPWAERGTEHAAEILAWGLMDITATPSHIQPTDNASLRHAFTSLTGVPPINDGSHPAPDPTTPPTRAGTTRR